LQKRLGNVKRDAIYKRARKVKREHGPMTTEDAIYLMAADAQIDVAKYLGAETVDRIRRLRQTAGVLTGAQPTRGSPGGVRGKTVKVIVGGTVELTDPLLPEKMLREARLMADKVYPLLYVLENSVRQLIIRVLSSVHGECWWSIAAPAETKSKVQTRKDQEDSKPWHGKRGVHEIYYTDLDDLKRIITSNANWPHFQAVLLNQQWVKQRLEEIETSRNVIAHSNPLEQHDLDRLTVYFGDWQRQIGASSVLIPQHTAPSGS
jgi:hypothetical protein